MIGRVIGEIFFVVKFKIFYFIQLNKIYYILGTIIDTSETNEETETGIEIVIVVIEEITVVPDLNREIVIEVS